MLKSYATILYLVPLLFSLIIFNATLSNNEYKKLTVLNSDVV